MAGTTGAPRGPSRAPVGSVPSQQPGAWGTPPGLSSLHSGAHQPWRFSPAPACGVEPGRRSRGAGAGGLPRRGPPPTGTSGRVCSKALTECACQGSKGPSALPFPSPIHWSPLPLIQQMFAEPHLLLDPGVSAGNRADPASALTELTVSCAWW